MRNNVAIVKQEILHVLLSGILLTGSPAIADDACQTASSNAATARAQHVAIPRTPASATDAASATASSCEHAESAAAVTNAVNGFPPLPEGVTELRFGEFFVNPVGPHGLEFTDKLRSLDGKRVRLAGYMVRQSVTVDRCFLLSPVPVILHEHEYGFADELPASTVHVFTAPESPAEVPFTPGVLLLTGTLSVGNRAEADGRVSLVRLQLDPPTAEQQKAVQAALSATAGNRKLRGDDSHTGHVH
ncbi:MAG TPA: hypothetical protein PKA41_06730 [Verrucomicrobiota bacterium]|nr:hypothetical protein [Verrucomicrobiota bacterium]